jgi:hypothetical protein
MFVETGKRVLKKFRILSSSIKIKVTLLLEHLLSLSLHLKLIQFFLTNNNIILQVQRSKPQKQKKKELQVVKALKMTNS